MSVPKPISDEDKANLREYFYTKDGILYAKKSYCNRVKKDQVVGADNGNGYLIVMCKGRLYLVHRVIYLLETGDWPDGVVDHINGDKSDNRIINLRAVSQAQNTKAFSPAHKDSSSRFRGVHWFKRYSKWQAQIMCDGKKKHLGYFDVEEDAAKAWNKAASELGFSAEAFNCV